MDILLRFLSGSISMLTAALAKATSAGKSI